MVRWSGGIAAAALCGCGAGPGEAPRRDIQVQGWSLESANLNGFFECLEAAGATLVSAHRGGDGPGLPENSIEAMAATLSRAPAVMEIDVASSADGTLFLMHDDTLDRTTTGSGRADALDWKDIRSLRLLDPDGEETTFSPPSFAGALVWAGGRTILQIDFKPSARYEDVAAEITRQGAEHRVIFIAYSMASAAKLHRLAPDVMISLEVDSQSDINRAVAAGIPANRLLGWTGTEAPRPRLFSILNNQDIEVIFGTLGGRQSIDAEIVRSGQPQQYVELAELGVDMIATDRPVAAANALDEAGRGPQAGQCGIVHS